MKFLTAIAIALISTSAFSADVTPQKVAELLIDQKTDSCLQELYSLRSKAEVRATTFTKSQSSKEIKYSLSFVLLQGGDMAIGAATLTVIEKVYPGAGEHGQTVTAVDRCKVESRFY